MVDVAFEDGSCFLQCMQTPKTFPFPLILAQSRCYCKIDPEAQPCTDSAV